MSGLLWHSVLRALSTPSLINDRILVQIASTAGIRPRPGLVWYNASKAACSNATKTMAVEYAKDKIRFNAVCPVVGSTAM